MNKLKWSTIKEAKFDKCISDAKMVKGYEKWTYNIEHKEIKSGKTYKITIEEI